jgi:hypothetical protein
MTRRGSPAQRPDLEALRPVDVHDLVRLGRERDGGYVVSRRALEATRVLVGLGVNDEWSFEEAFLAEAPRTRLVLVDGTVGRRRYAWHALERAARASRRLVRGHVRRARLAWREARSYAAAWPRLEAFLAPEGRRLVQAMVGLRDGRGTVCWKTLRRELGEPDRGRDLFVKMDIEGAEYGVLPAVLEDGGRIAGLALEFHRLDLHWGQLLELQGAWEGQFAVVHVHGNNGDTLVSGTAVPKALEVTLVARDLLTPEETGRHFAGPLPRPGLDFPNDPERSELPLLGSLKD